LDRGLLRAAFIALNSVHPRNFSGGAKEVDDPQLTLVHPTGDGDQHESEWASTLGIFVHCPSHALANRSEFRWIQVSDHTGWRTLCGVSVCASRRRSPVGEGPTQGGCWLNLVACERPSRVTG